MLAFSSPPFFPAQAGELESDPRRALQRSSALGVCADSWPRDGALFRAVGGRRWRSLWGPAHAGERWLKKRSKADEDALLPMPLPALRINNGFMIRSGGPENHKPPSSYRVLRRRLRSPQWSPRGWLSGRESSQWRRPTDFRNNSKTYEATSFTINKFNH